MRPLSAFRLALFSPHALLMSWMVLAISGVHSKAYAQAAADASAEGAGELAPQAAPQAPETGTATTETAPAEPAEADPTVSDPAAEPAVTPQTSEPAAPLPMEGAVSEDDTVSGINDAVHKQRMAVVIVRRWARRQFDLNVANVLMEPFAHRTELVPLMDVRRAVAKLHVTPNQLHLPATLRMLGRRLNADYVMIVEPAGRPRRPFVFVALVDVHTGETPVAKRMPMPGLQVTASHANTVVPALEDALGLNEPSPAAGAATTPGTAAPDAPSLSTEAPKAGEDTVLGAEPEPSQEPSGLQGPELAHARLGLSLLQRIGHLKDTQSSGVTPPQYAGTNNNANPFFPAFTFEGRAYSGLARKSRRSYLDGIGLSLEFEMAPVRSYTSGDTTTTITSRVSAVNVSALYRFLLLPKKQLSPMTEVGVGFDYFDFPLANSQYPGTAYRSPNLSLAFTFLAHPSVGFNLYGAWRPTISPSDQAAHVLGTSASGHGFNLGGSVNGRWRFLTAEIAFLYKSFSLQWKGQTTLPTTVTLNDGSQAEFTNIKQTDSLKNIAFRLGVVY